MRVENAYLSEGKGRGRRMGRGKGWLVFPSRWEREVCLARFFFASYYVGGIGGGVEEH